jgi:hypothetical protein
MSSVRCRKRDEAHGTIWDFLLVLGLGGKLPAGRRKESYIP